MSGKGPTATRAPKAPRPAADEAGLVERFRQGNEAAFEELFRRYREAIHAVAWRLCGDSEEALDVVQEAFIRAYRHAGGFRAESGFYSWVRRIATNLAIDRLRARREGDSGALEEETLAEQALAPDAARLAEENPVERAAGNELAQALAAALQELGPEHRAALVLHANEGLSYKEIAEQMDCPIGTVMSRLFYARRILADKLRRYLAAP
jgi:RNA polymerase sigma-70 factor (ECF subfamily)